MAAYQEHVVKSLKCSRLGCLDIRFVYCGSDGMPWDNPVLTHCFQTMDLHSFALHISRELQTLHFIALSSGNDGIDHPEFWSISREVDIGGNSGEAITLEPVTKKEFGEAQDSFLFD